MELIFKSNVMILRTWEEVHFSCLVLHLKSGLIRLNVKEITQTTTC